MDIRNIVWDRVLDIYSFNSSSDELQWCATQPKNCKISITSDSEDAVDAVGTPIATFERAKSCEFSAENAVFDLRLAAAQAGTSVVESTALATFNVPKIDHLTVATADTLTVKQTPVASSLKYLYRLNNDGSYGEKYTVGESASGKTVTLSNKVVTFATGEAAVGDRFVCAYEYLANGTSGSQAVKLTEDAKHFNTAGRIVMRVLTVDVCDQSNPIAAFVEFPNGKLLSNHDIEFAATSVQNLTIKAMQDYCDANKVLYNVYFPDEVYAG